MVTDVTDESATIGAAEWDPDAMRTETAAADVLNAVPAGHRDRP
jgi:hypothetical protein